MSLKPTPQTERKQQRERERDAIDFVFDVLLASNPSQVEHYTAIKRSLRLELGGLRVYIKRREDMTEHILRMWNGRNAAEIARTLGVSRAWVYRVLRKPAK